MTPQRTKSSAAEQRRSKRALLLVDQVVAYIHAHSGCERLAVVRAIGRSENDVSEAMEIANRRGLVACCRRHALPALWMTPEDGRLYAAKVAVERAKRQELHNAASKLRKQLARDAKAQLSDDENHDDWPAERVIGQPWQAPSEPPAANSVFALARMAA